MTTRLSEKEKAKRKLAREDARWLERHHKTIEADADALERVLHRWAFNFRPLPDLRRLQKRIEREVIPSHLMRYKATILKLEKQISNASGAARSALYRARKKAERAQWLKDHPGRLLRDLDELLAYPGVEGDDTAFQRYRSAWQGWDMYMANRTPMPAELFDQREAQDEAA